MITIKHKKYGDITFADGTSRQEIANYLVEADSIGGEQYGTLETLGTQAGRSMGSSIRQIKDWVGIGDELSQYEDELAEYKSRIMMEQSPATSVVGMLAGGVLDPVTIPAMALKPLTFASKVATFGARGAAQGAAGGALEPIYDQYGDSTVLNIMSGTALGGGLGAGIGKLLTKSIPKTDAATEQASDTLQETSERTLTNLASSLDETPVRTPQQALDKVAAEMELEAAGAPTSANLGIMRRAVESSKSKIAALDAVINRMKDPTGKAPLGARNAARKVAAQKIEAQKELQGLESKYSEGKTLRKAAENLKKVKEGKVVGIEGFAARLKAAVPIQRSPLAQAVNQATPQRAQINPFNTNTSRILGTDDAADVKYNNKTGKFESVDEAPINIRNTYGVGDAVEGLPEPRAGGSAGVSFGTRVGAELLPRTAGKPEVTGKVVAGKFTGENAKTRINIKESRESTEAREAVQRRLDRGEEPTPVETAKLSEADEAAKALEDYKLFVQKLAGSRSLDTAALRGFLKGRYTFKGIEKEAAALLKKHGIEDFEDMVNYILDDSKRIFSAAEMEMLSPLFGLAERKLYNAMEMVRHTEGMSDDMIAVLHSEINMYYGIQAWNKGQGSKVSAALNHRNKMLKDIAEDRQIDSLWAGVKCK